MTLRKSTQRRYDELFDMEKALHEALRDGAQPTELHKRANQLEKALRRVPAVMMGDRGHGLVALIAEVRGQWDAAVEARRMQIAHFAFMRELAQMENPAGRRTILRDYDGKRVAGAYRLLSRDLRMLNERAAANRALTRARIYKQL